MIIETTRDVVHISGSIHKNLWLSIRAAAGMLLQECPEGIIVDCKDVQDISENGAKTFLDAVRDIEAAQTRIVVVGLPPDVLQVLKSVPGVRSQLPIADSIEAARASLQKHRASMAPAQVSAAGTRRIRILVPLIADTDLTYGADLAARFATTMFTEVHLIYLMEIDRSQPLNNPVPEKEEQAAEAMSVARQLVQNRGVTPVEHIDRVREAKDGLFTALREIEADMVVLGASHHSEETEGHEVFDSLVEMLLHRAPCEVVVGRLKKKETLA